MLKIFMVGLFVSLISESSMAINVTMSCTVGLRVFGEVHVRTFTAKATSSSATHARKLACDKAYNECLGHQWYLGRQGICETI